MERRKKKILDSYLYKYMAVASIISCNTPLEVIKMRMITNAELFQLNKITNMYTNIFNCAKTVLAKEGLRAFWNGNVIMVARVMPVESINYETRRYLQQKLPNQLGYNIFIAIVSGITAFTIIYPSDIVRQTMNNNTQSHISISSTIKSIYR